MSVAYYNERDPYAAQWLRNLIAGGHIAPGDVDERDIRDVRPYDLDGYTQCHFFAGIGVWSYALRRAGWSDDRPVWSGSCPCQPFSAAGAGNGFADERHLWPAWFHLIDECRPTEVFGEQVASKDGLGWLDLVSTDMQGADYAFGAQDRCSAGFGAPHIRQRLYFVGTDGLYDPAGPRFVAPRQWAEGEARDEARLRGPERGRAIDGLADTGDGCVGNAHATRLPIRERPALVGTRRRQEGRTIEQSGGPLGGLADDDDDGLSEDAVREFRNAKHHIESCGGDGGLVDPDRGRAREESGNHRQVGEVSAGKLRADDSSALPLRTSATRRLFESSRVVPPLDRERRPGPTNGPWADADWLFCRDGKWRPVEPGTFPLAHGVASRVGRLRAFGNAIDAENATDFIDQYLEHEADGGRDLDALSSIDAEDLIG